MNSIYIHIPFCKRKCNYCAFNSKVGSSSEIENYVDALIAEIKNFSCENKNICTIYFGGGTPTILNLNQLEKIFDTLQKKFAIDNNAEITIESNPGTVDKNYLRGLREIGLNRISIGVQSFNDELLKILGRIHDSKTALKTIQTAKNFFNNISIDLMYSLPKQKISDIRRAVEIVSNSDIQHISIYGLEIEENTKFFELQAQNKLNLPTDELSAEMYDFIMDTLPKFNFNRYEISNFAKKNFESRHNLGYWTGRKYFGFGAGAHSYDRKIRTSNICNVNSYIKKISSGENISQIEEIITKQAAMEEFCFLGLRIVAGIEIAEFERIFGENIFEVFGRVIEKNISLSLLENSNGRIYLTGRGMKLGNMVFADFLLEK